MTADDLRDWMKRHRLTRRAAAQALGIGRSTLDILLAGRRYDRSDDEVTVPPHVSQRCAEIDARGSIEFAASSRPSEPGWMPDARVLILSGRSKLYVSQLLGLSKSVFYRQWDQHNSPPSPAGNPTLKSG